MTAWSLTDATARAQDPYLPTDCRYAVGLRAPTPDTVVVNVDGKETLVRYIHVDAPAHRRDWRMAREANQMLVVGQALCMEPDAADADFDGTLLRHVWLYEWMETGPALVSELLVDAGQLRVEPDPPNTRNTDRLRAAGLRAAASGYGIWRMPCE